MALPGLFHFPFCRGCKDSFFTSPKKGKDVQQNLHFCGVLPYWTYFPLFKKNDGTTAHDVQRNLMDEMKCLSVHYIGEREKKPLYII